MCQRRITCEVAFDKNTLSKRSFATLLTGFDLEPFVEFTIWFEYVCVMPHQYLNLKSCWRARIFLCIDF